MGGFQDIEHFGAIVFRSAPPQKSGLAQGEAHVNAAYHAFLRK